MFNYVCLAFRYVNQSSDQEERRRLAIKGAVSREINSSSIKYVLSDGSALIDNGIFVEADENRWWLK